MCVCAGVYMVKALGAPGGLLVTCDCNLSFVHHVVKGKGVQVREARPGGPGGSKQGSRGRGDQALCCSRLSICVWDGGLVGFWWGLET